MWAKSCFQQTQKTFFFFSKETIAKMIEASYQRPARNGKPRSGRKNSAYQIYRNKVLATYNNEGAISGVKATKQNLVVHHLISAHFSKDLAYNPKNGIVLTAFLHKLFHNKYGYKNNSIEQIRNFLVYLVNKKLTISKPISSQASPEGDEGSETRAYNPERVMKLHERLGQIEKELLANKGLFPDS